MAGRPWAVFLALSAAFCDHPGRVPPSAPGGPESASTSVVPDSTTEPDSSGAVQAEMRNVLFQVAPGVTLTIRRLRGRLQPIGTARPPTLDDKTSFTLEISSGEISIDTASLGTLLTKHVFAYPGSPLSHLRIATEGKQLVQRGVLHGLPFTVRADVSLTEAGWIRLHPQSVKVVGIGVRGLMRFFGLDLEELAKVAPGRGIRIEANDFLIDPTAILPPPRTRGRVTHLEVMSDRLVQTFGGAEPASPLANVGTGGGNYMYFRGAHLRFGKLTMSDTDLLIQDDDPSNPFEFSLDRYNEQLVAGYSRNTPDHGLVVRMPDLSALTAGGQRRPPISPPRP